MTVETPQDLAGQATEAGPAQGGSAVDACASRWPATVQDVEMSHPLAPISATGPQGQRFDRAWLLVRVFEEPVGVVQLSLDGGDAAAEDVAAAVRVACGEAVRQRVRAAGGDVAAALAGHGTGTALVPDFLAAHADWERNGPLITVVICTRDRPVDLARALDSLRGQSYRRFQILVVDNAPEDDATERLVRARPADDCVDYVCEPRPGLSWARNAGLRAVATAVLAWLDDDEVADRHWLMEIAAAFCLHPTAAAVSGSVVPAELRTQSQVWFEQYGGHTKGRGFAPDIFASARGAQHPLYPLPPFGVGANMAFATDRLRSIGGFDTGLGAGTAACGGEDTLVFSQLLLAGSSIVYRPTALTRHYHRPDYAGLVKQMRGYGVGLTAYYASLLRSNWRLVVPLLALAPRAVRDTLAKRDEAAHGGSETFPPHLLRIKTRGMLVGPLAYVRARRTASRLGREPR